jgi:hypothetical protein
VLPLSTLAAQGEYAEFFRTHYGFAAEPAHGPGWRRIDEDWLNAASQLALALDNDTNNTSLVLAFELSDGQVLLFPGDAQAGNWLSWGNVRWLEGEHARSGRELLRQVVVYKVGHHGSHNATLAAQGLELMERDELVVLLPVDELQAQRKRWAMPFGPLYERLLAKTKGRVLRADQGVPVRPAGMPERQWQQFLQRVRTDPSDEQLWLELTVPAVAAA